MNLKLALILALLHICALPEPNYAGIAEIYDLTKQVAISPCQEVPLDVKIERVYQVMPQKPSQAAVAPASLQWNYYLTPSNKCLNQQHTVQQPTNGCIGQNVPKDVKIDQVYQNLAQRPSYSSAGVAPANLPWSFYPASDNKGFEQQYVLQDPTNGNKIIYHGRYRVY